MGGDAFSIKKGQHEINNLKFHHTTFSCNINNISMKQLHQQANNIFSNTAHSPHLHQPQQHESSSIDNLNNPILTPSYKDRKGRRKIIRKKPTLLQRVTIPPAPAFPHVFNFLGLIGINQRTLRDATYEESYYRSMFYIRTVEKVELRRHALLVFTRTAGQATPTQYIVDRLRSFGVSSLYDLAEGLETVQRLYAGVNYRKDLEGSCESEPLARFIEAMQDRIYMCKLAPNRILISRRLLEFLGEDPELYGVRICKYQTPLDEIISGEQYSKVIAKSVQNVGYLCAFLKGEISLEELQQHTCMEFEDYLYAREQKMFCRFSLSMPTPLISCLQVKQQLGDMVPTHRSNLDMDYRKRMQHEMRTHGYGQTSVLRHLMELPANLLSDHCMRVAGYSSRQ